MEMETVKEMETVNELETVMEPEIPADKKKIKKAKKLKKVKIKTKPTKGVIILIVIAVVMALLILLRIFGTKKEIVTDPLSTVSVGHVERGNIEIETSLIGTVMPGDVYYVIPKVSGEITKIYVATGDTVKEGDPICDIDNSKAIDAAKLSLDGAKVQYQAAQEGVTLAKTNLDRMSALLQTGDISRQAYEQTKNGYDQAAAGLEGAKISLDGAQMQYDTQVEFATVTAPVSGVVESANMSLNGMASPSAGQVCIISSNGDNKITFNVTDRLLDSLKPGAELKVAKQGSEYTAKIKTISTLPSAQTGLYQAEAVFTAKNSIAKGSSVKLSFVSEQAEDAIVIDTDNVHYDGGKTYVYTLSYNDADSALEGNSSAGVETIISDKNTAGTVHKSEVVTGISNSEKTEIISGIDEDSLVIMSWTSQLYEGAQVQVLPEE